MCEKKYIDEIYRLNSLGFDFKRDTLGKAIPEQLGCVKSYFCIHYCKYVEMCNDLSDFNCDMPWCPLEVLI